MSPARRPGTTRPGPGPTFVLAFYVLASALMPLAHHDVVCHLKSSTHCTTCLIGGSGESAAEPVEPGALLLKDAGAATPYAVLCPEASPLSSKSGRAPPVA